MRIPSLWFYAAIADKQRQDQGQLEDGEITSHQDEPFYLKSEVEHGTRVSNFSHFVQYCPLTVPELPWGHGQGFIP